MPRATELPATRRGEGDGAGIECASPGELLCKAHTLRLCMEVQAGRYMDDHREMWVGRDPRLYIGQVSYGFVHQDRTLALADVDCGQL